MNGFGVMVAECGRKYQGFFEDNRRKGLGFLTDCQGRTHYGRFGEFTQDDGKRKFIRWLKRDISPEKNFSTLKELKAFLVKDKKCEDQ